MFHEIGDFVNRAKGTRRAALAGAAALLALFASTAPAMAAPGDGDGRSKAARTAQSNGLLPAGFADWAEVFAVQNKLNAAAEKIVAAGGAGYAGIVAAPQNRALQVYWKGAVPASVTKLAGGLKVPVSFASAAYSQREMIAETKRLAADPNVLSVGPEADGSGLTIAVSSAGRKAIQARTGAVGTARMPLHVREEAAPQALSRPNDFAPYWGGARYTTPLGGCTTGFAIFWQGLDHMLSAGHCGNNGQVAVDGGGNAAADTMGTIFNDDTVRDTLMIDVASEGWAYVDAFDGNTGVDVVGAGTDFVGNLVCTDGARTGEHCGMQVTHVDQSDNGWFPLIRVIHPSGGCAGARGDSGGPVVVDNGTSLIGRGTISTGRPGSGNVVCPNAPVSDSSNVVWYAPLLRPAGGPTTGSLQHYGASIL
jgi:hypothetical protein